MPAIIEQEFHETMIGLYKEVNEKGYTASAFLEMVYRMGEETGTSRANTCRTEPVASRRPDREGAGSVAEGSSRE